LINTQSQIYQNNNTIYGYILDDSLKINSTLDFPNDFILPAFNKDLEELNRSYGLFTLNNTFVAIMTNASDNKSWQLVSAKLNKFLPDGKIIFIYSSSLF